MTTDFASPEGLVRLPTRKAEAYRSGKLTLDQIPHVTEPGRRLSAYEMPEPYRTTLPKPNPQGPPPASSVEVNPQPKITSNNGWLSPDGTFYPCNYSGHNDLADELCHGPTQIEQLGWVKICCFKLLTDSGQPENTALPGTKPPTQAQIDRIFDWLGYLPDMITLASKDTA
jgi:hypothetical protein